MMTKISCFRCHGDFCVFVRILRFGVLAEEGWVGRIFLPSLPDFVANFVCL